MPIRVAWVESPLQLINAAEYAHHSDELVRICLRHGATQLAATAQALGEHLPANAVIAGSWSHAAASPFATATHRLIGDALSGQVRSVIAATGAHDVVLVDDGSSALALAELLAARRPLRRSSRPEGNLQRKLGAIASRRLTSALERGRLQLWTAYSTAVPVARLRAQGATVTHNAYRWVRSLPPVEPTGVAARHVVIGSALASDGFVDADAYFTWLARLAQDGPVLYLPHRRETEQDLAACAAIPGVNVHRPVLPAELALATSPALERVTTLPSSVIATLGQVLGSHVNLDVHAVPDAWWTPQAKPAFRDMLATASARQTYPAAA